MLTNNEKTILYKKYKDEGLNFKEINLRMNQLINHSKLKKQKKDFKEEFNKLWTGE